MSETPKTETKIQYKLTPEEMWNCERGTGETFGIEGYEVPRQYYDYHQVKWFRERKEILDKHARVWPPPDWPKSKDGDKAVPPVRWNFIDDVVKWAKSFNDPNKEKELREKYTDKGIFNPPKPKEYVDQRAKFLEHVENEKKRIEGLPKVQEWKVAAIEAADAKKKDFEASRKTQTQKNLEAYANKSQWPRCDRVTIVGK
ncbi:MAG: hypothetical protein MJ252_08750 [archaeon]|nr:hypothetical protein [archaeon]